MNASEPSESLEVAEALEKVTDKKSFVAFVRALIAEREVAEQVERERPEYYKFGGALGWQNSEISNYLSAALTQFEDSGQLQTESSGDASWRTFAEFLYMGKIYE